MWAANAVRAFGRISRLPESRLSGASPLGSFRPLRYCRDSSIASQPLDEADLRLRVAAS